MFSWFKPRSKPQMPSGKTILVIDDDATTLKIVEHALKQAGYLVLLAANGEEGIQIAQKNNPDIIITDVLMPNMDGFMLLKEVKHDENMRSKSVLILTSRQNVGDTFRRFGADGFLTKPVDPALLLAEIKRLLS